MVWLFKNNVGCDSKMSNIELYGLVKNHRKPKQYVLDDTLKEAHHQVLRLPQFSCDLNPLKLLQRFVVEKVTQSNINDSNAIAAAIHHEIRKVKSIDWEREIE